MKHALLGLLVIFAVQSSLVFGSETTEKITLPATISDYRNSLCNYGDHAIAIRSCQKQIKNILSGHQSNKALLLNRTFQKFADKVVLVDWVRLFRKIFMGPFDKESLAQASCYIGFLSDLLKQPDPSKEMSSFAIRKVLYDEIIIRLFQDSASAAVVAFPLLQRLTTFQCDYSIHWILVWLVLSHFGTVPFVNFMEMYMRFIIALQPLTINIRSISGSIKPHLVNNNAPKILIALLDLWPFALSWTNANWVKHVSSRRDHFDLRNSTLYDEDRLCAYSGIVECICTGAGGVAFNLQHSVVLDFKAIFANLDPIKIQSLAISMIKSDFWILFELLLKYGPKIDVEQLLQLVLEHVAVDPVLRESIWVRVIFMLAAHARLFSRDFAGMVVPSGICGHHNFLDQAQTILQWADVLPRPTSSKLFSSPVSRSFKSLDLKHFFQHKKELINMLNARYGLKAWGYLPNSDYDNMSWPEFFEALDKLFVKTR